MGGLGTPLTEKICWVVFDRFPKGGNKKTQIFYGFMADGKRWPPPYGQLFIIFLLVVCLTRDNEHMCSKTDFSQEESCPCPLNDHFQEASPSGWSFRRSRPLWGIICTRLVPPVDNLQPRKGHDDCILRPFTIKTSKRSVGAKQDVENWLYPCPPTPGWGWRAQVPPPQISSGPSSWSFATKKRAWWLHFETLHNQNI